MLYILNTTTSSGRATQVGNTSSGFGVNEKEPRGLAAIGNTLYMLGDDNDELYTAVPR